jgi:hypothetical protein
MVAAAAIAAFPGGITATRRNLHLGRGFRPGAQVCRTDVERRCRAPPIPGLTVTCPAPGGVSQVGRLSRATSGRASTAQVGCQAIVGVSERKCSPPPAAG